MLSRLAIPLVILGTHHDFDLTRIDRKVGPVAPLSYKLQGFLHHAC